jgi:hypothetical protein
MKLIEDLFWLFGLRLWIGFERSPGRWAYLSNAPTFSDMWRHRHAPMKVWVD